MGMVYGVDGIGYREMDDMGWPMTWEGIEGNVNKDEVRRRWGWAVLWMES